MLGNTRSSGLVALGVFLALSLPSIPALVARSKGRSALGFYLFGLACWLPALVTALIISPGPSAASTGWRPLGSITPPTTPIAPQVDAIAQLERLDGLLARGAITKAEFEDQKRKLLG